MSHLLQSHHHNVVPKLATLGGTLLSLTGIESTEVVKTAVLAAIGATVSFVVSLALKKVFHYIRTRT